MPEWVSVWSAEGEKESDYRESAEGAKHIVREGGNLGGEGSGEAYLLFLASSLPPPLADAESCSDDNLWRTSTSWPLSLRHKRTASSLWGWGEKSRREGGREGGSVLSPRRFPCIFSHSHKSPLISIIILHCKWKRISIYHYSALITGAHSGINIKDYFNCWFMCSAY